MLKQAFRFLFLVPLFVSAEGSQASSFELKIPCVAGGTAVKECRKPAGECNQASKDLLQHLQKFAEQKVEFLYSQKRDLQTRLPAEVVDPIKFKSKLSSDDQALYAPWMAGANVCVPVSTQFKSASGALIGNETVSNFKGESCGGTFGITLDKSSATVKVSMAKLASREWSYMAGAKVLSLIAAFEGMKSEIKSKKGFSVPTACGEYAKVLDQNFKNYEQFLSSYDISKSCDPNTGLISDKACTDKSDLHSCYLTSSQKALEAQFKSVLECSLNEHAKIEYLKRFPASENAFKEGELHRVGERIGRECADGLSTWDKLGSSSKITEKIQNCYDSKIDQGIKEAFERLFPEAIHGSISRTESNADSKSESLLFAGLSLMGSFRRRKKYVYGAILPLLFAGCSGDSASPKVDFPPCVDSAGVPVMGLDFPDLENQLPKCCVTKDGQTAKARWEETIGPEKPTENYDGNFGSEYQIVQRGCGGSLPSCFLRVAPPEGCPGYKPKTPDGGGSPIGNGFPGFVDVYKAGLIEASKVMETLPTKERPKFLDNYASDLKLNSVQAAIQRASGGSKALAKTVSQTSAGQAAVAQGSQGGLLSGSGASSGGGMMTAGMGGSFGSDSNHSGAPTLRPSKDDETKSETPIGSAMGDTGSEYSQGAGGGKSGGDSNNANPSGGVALESGAFNGVWNSGKTGNPSEVKLGRAPSSEGNTANGSGKKTAEGDDYFFLTKKEDDLFKLVEGRYRKTLW